MGEKRGSKKRGGTEVHVKEETRIHIERERHKQAKRGKDGKWHCVGVSIKHSVRKMPLHKNSIHHYATQSSAGISVIATTGHIVARFMYGCL